MTIETRKPPPFTGRDGVFLTQFVIYRRPLDYPDNYVVRCWKIAPGVTTPDYLQLAPNLEAARRLLPRGLVNIGRMEGDDPSIEEVWT